MLKLAVFISGGGTNLQALIDVCRNKSLKAEIKAVISNSSKAYGLERARKAEIPTYHVSKFVYPDDKEFVSSLFDILNRHSIDLIVLAGYMKLLPPEIISKYHGRIINIHPALLPKYGGKGMYGLNVHKAVLQAGDKVSGATVHLADEHYDQGSILIQRQVPVEDNDTPETLAARILKVEHQILPMAVSLFIKK